MFDVAPTELLIVALVALVVIGPKDLPNVMRTVGQWVGRARGMARHFRTGIDTMIREAELEELEAKWKAENDRIMRDFPNAGDAMPSRPLILGEGSDDAPADAQPQPPPPQLQSPPQPDAAPPADSDPRPLP